MIFFRIDLALNFTLCSPNQRILPQRGLKWTSGWIDRGGWKPQQFGGSYFNARAESLVWHYADDIELGKSSCKVALLYLKLLENLRLCSLLFNNYHPSNNAINILPCKQSWTLRTEKSSIAPRHASGNRIGMFRYTLITLNILVII